jgi:hypothetical protein
MAGYVLLFLTGRTDGQDDLDSVRDMPGIHVILEVGVRSATLSSLGNRLVSPYVVPFVVKADGQYRLRR